jgi:hypothetical protein
LNDRLRFSVSSWVSNVSKSLSLSLSISARDPKHRSLETEEGGDLQTLWYVRFVLDTEEGGDLQTLWYVRFVKEALEGGDLQTLWYPQRDASTCF